MGEFDEPKNEFEKQLRCARVTVVVALVCVQKKCELEEMSFGC